MSRSKWKLKYFSNFLLRKIIILKKKKKLNHRNFIFYDRSSNIPSCLKSFFFRIHKGIIFRRLMINNYNIGFKFGEFSFTRKPYHFPLKNKKKNKNFFIRK